MKKRKRKAVTLQEFIRDEKRLKTLLDALSLGGSLETAAYLVDLSPSTLWRWLDMGKLGKSEDAEELSYKIHNAMAQAALLAEANIRDSQPLTWLRGPYSRHVKAWSDNEEPASSARPDAVPHYADMAEALLELHRAGIIHFQQPPVFPGISRDSPLPASTPPAPERSDAGDDRDSTHDAPSQSIS